MLTAARFASARLIVAVPAPLCSRSLSALARASTQRSAHRSAICFAPAVFARSMSSNAAPAAWSDAAAAAPSASGSARPLRILVTFPLPPPSLELLKAHPRYPSVALDIRTCEGDMEVAEQLQQQVQLHAPLDGLICRPGNKVDAELIASAGPNLRAISTLSVGYNHIDRAEATKRGILVGHCPDTVTQTTADTALALLLAAARLIIPARENVSTGMWGKTPFDCYNLCGTDVHGSTVGIVGLGRIGLAVAKRLRGFDCKILYSGRRPRPEDAKLVDAEYVPFDELLRRSDFVLPQCPFTEETKHLFNADAFGKMKPSAVFVNTTRGGVVDQTALYDALKQGKIWAAALDVTDPEPLPMSDPLHTLPNCLIVPHIGTATKQCRHETAAETIRNLLEALTAPAGGTGVYCNKL